MAKHCQKCKNFPKTVVLTWVVTTLWSNSQLICALDLQCWPIWATNHSMPFVLGFGRHPNIAGGFFWWWNQMITKNENYQKGKWSIWPKKEIFQNDQKRKFFKMTKNGNLFKTTKDRIFFMMSKTQFFWNNQKWSFFCSNQKRKFFQDDQKWFSQMRK